MSDYYQLLGVDRKATDKEIKRAYHRRLRKIHPDYAGPGHEEEVKQVNKAYEVLSDPEKRQMYDLGGEEAFSGRGTAAGAGDFGAFASAFSSMFGGAFGGGGPRSRQSPGSDRVLPVELDLADVAFGTTLKQDIEVYVLCEQCQGSCTAPGTSPVTCTQCHGNGSVQRTVRSLFGEMLTSQPCPRCEGFGDVIVTPCQNCSGTGCVQSHKEIEVEVPAGVSDDMTLRMRGQGDVGPAGGPTGDLYIKFQVRSHPFLDRDGDDLVTELRVPMTAAALGATINLETLDGTKKINVRPGTQNGTVVTLKQLGINHMNRPGRGNLQVRIVVETPSQLDAHQRDLLMQLAQARGEDNYEPVNKDGSVLDRLKGALGK